MVAEGITAILYTPHLTFTNLKSEVGVLNVTDGKSKEFTRGRKLRQSEAGGQNDDPEPKLSLSVLGTVQAGRTWCCVDFYTHGQPRGKASASSNLEQGEEAARGEVGS